MDVAFQETDLSIRADLMEEDMEFEHTFSGSIIVPETDHAKLKNRDAEDQHPIRAITRLEQELRNRVTTDSVISALDIINIMEG